ncbi:MAG: L-threonylcarbamoyladenylate synthase [Collinsella sp.]
MQTVYRVYEGAREPHRLAVERTAELLGRGGLALIPTETVYGVAVAVNAFSGAVPQDTSEFPSWPRDPQAAVNGAAVPALGTGYRRIFTQARELTQTVAWLVDGVEALDRYGVDIPEDARVLARRCWPGALTIVVKAGPCVPTFMRAADDTVALRASASRGPSAHPRLRQSPCLHERQHARRASPASFAAVEGASWRGRCCRRRR